MAIIKSAMRNAMPASEFGQPATRGFPMNNKVHDRMAISGATRSQNAGNISASTADRIKAEARSKLHPGVKRAPDANARMVKVEASPADLRSDRARGAPTEGGKADMARDRKMGR